MSEQKKLKNKPISKWRQRIGYGVSDFACNLIWQMISLYLLFFYVDIMSLNASAVSIMFLITRIFDGISDLFVGYLIDHTHTRWGKSRPYFLLGAVPFSVFAFLCFSVPAFSSQGKLVYAYITYFGLSLSYTIVNVPMASILPSLTNDTNERTNLATSRKFFAFLGATVVSATALKLVSYFGQGNDAVGFKKLMIVFGFISCIVFIFTFFNVRELLDEKKDVSLKKVIYSLSQNQPWKVFAINILFMWTGYFLQTAALVYYYSSVVGSKSLSIQVATIMSVVPMIANFFVPFLSKRVGKRNFYSCSSMVQAIGIIIIIIGGMSHGIILFGAIISALGYGMKESIYFSMQADPVDYGEWKTGINTSGSLSAINGFLGKVAQAISGAVAGLLLSWGNYQPGAVNQPSKAITAIQLMYMYLPLILIILSVITMSFYKLDTNYATVKKELEKRLQAST